jgi:protein-S-isoprenylcysteine O-methyltransferase Ste14
MHPVTFILQIVAFLWIASEIALAILTRVRRRAAVIQDAGSLALLWGAVAGGVWAGIALRAVRNATIPLSLPWLHAISLLILAGGLALRWTAIFTLRRFFTASVTVLQNHELVRTGLYRHLRHPSYSGLLLAFIGVAVSDGNWLSLPAVVVPVFLALVYRIRVEESALVSAFGRDYAEYRKSTKGLIPGVF